jgi:hypothetical protein
MKWCPRCERELELAAFPPNAGRRDGLSGYCRECRATYNREREARYRAAVIALLGGECVRCFIADPRVLAIDHIGGGGSAARRRGGRKQTQFYKDVLAAPDGYQLLCHNCNWVKRLEEDPAAVSPAVV